MTVTRAVDILLVEDNPKDVELTLRALRKAGIANPVEVAGDGAKALEYLFGTGPYAGREANRAPSLVLLDLKLPKLSGLEVLRRLRADERTQQVPVVALTSSGEDSDVAEAYRLGVNSYVVKPVEFEGFAKAVGQLGLYWLLRNEPLPLGAMGASLRILMVEDVPADAELNASELRRAGLSLNWWRVETREALLSALEDLHPDVVLCDYSLPSFSAPEALGLLRERAPDLPAIIVTGTQDEETAVECMRMGAWDYVQKEHLVRLVPAVHRALEQARAVRTRKRAEEELLSSEARFRLLIESIPDALVVSDREGRIEMVNAQAEAMFGYARDELIGHTVETLIPEALRGRHLSHDTMSSAAPGLHQAVSGLNLLARRKDGSELPVEINRSPVETANDLLVISVIRDVTEQRRGAEEIVAQRRFLREVIDLNPNFVFAKDRRGRYTLVNKTVADFYGATVEALIGQTDADLNRNAEEVELIRRNDLEVLETGRDMVILEQRNTDATGQERWLQVVKRAIVPVGGTERHVLVVATDITERKQLEVQLFQTQKLEAIGQLAGGVAHDFNNLLTVILGRCALVLPRLSPDASPRRDINLIEKTAQRAATLTRQLLAFSRKQILEPKVLDLNAVVPGIATMLQRLIGEDIELVYRPGAALGLMKADPGQIEQVIMNLAVNARDAMPDGGHITIETGNVELGEDYARQHVGVQPGQYVMLAVSDTGVGMDAATQARIFDPFFTTKAPGKGTGLGLSTVYGIVKQSGGNIGVYSEPGRGTTFKVYLPRVEDAAGPVDVIRPAPGRGTESILLVEDEEEVRALAREILEGYGYTVFEARDVADAILISERHTGPIDLLVTDVVMPQMSGRALAERLAPLRPEMKVLFMSGYTANAIVHHGVLDAGTSFVQKPFTPDALARKVREVLDAP